MTGRECSNDDIGLVALDGIVMHTSIDSLQSIVVTQSEGTDVEGVLGQ